MTDNQSKLRTKQRVRLTKRGQELFEHQSGPSGIGTIVDHDPTRRPISGGHTFCYRVRWEDGGLYNYRDLDIKPISEYRIEGNALILLEDLS